MYKRQQEDAKETEKAVYKKFLARKESMSAKIIKELSSAEAKAYKNLSPEMQAYMSFIANDVLRDGTNILLKDKIDTEDQTYKAWKEEDAISLREYLQYAISKNWVDTSKLSLIHIYNIKVLFPMKEGEISHFNNMQYLLTSLLKKGKRKRHAKYVIAVPTNVTEVQKRAFFDLMVHSFALAEE